MNIFQTEPVLVLGLLEAAIVFAAAFGFNLTKEQTVAVMALAAAVLKLVARSRVTPI